MGLWDTKGLGAALSDLGWNKSPGCSSREAPERTGEDRGVTPEPRGARLASGGSRRRWVASWRQGSAPAALRSGALFTDFLEASVVGAGAGHLELPGDTHLSARSPKGRRELTGRVWLGWTQKSLGTKPKAKGHQYFTGQEPCRFLPRSHTSVPRYSGCFFW